MGWQQHIHAEFIAYYRKHYKAPPPTRGNEHMYKSKFDFFSEMLKVFYNSMTFSGVEYTFLGFPHSR